MSFFVPTNGASCMRSMCRSGSNLFPKEAIKAGDWATITKLCKDALDIVKEVRQSYI